MDKQRLSSIAKQFGTPSFVFDESALARRMREVKAIVGSTVHLCYSIKANPFLVKETAPLVQRLEICSEGEYRICEALGLDARQFVGRNHRSRTVRSHSAGVGAFVSIKNTLMVLT